MVSLTVYVAGAACASVAAIVPRSRAASAHGLTGADDFFISDYLPRGQGFTGGQANLRPFPVSVNRWTPPIQGAGGQSSRPVQDVGTRRLPRRLVSRSPLPVANRSLGDADRGKVQPSTQPTLNPPCTTWHRASLSADVCATSTPGAAIPV